MLKEENSSLYVEIDELKNKLLSVDASKQSLLGAKGQQALQNALVAETEALEVRQYAILNGVM